MGTSISQPSSRNTNWSPVHAGYQNRFIPEIRIINEIWRACENDNTPVSNILKDDAIYKCFESVKTSNNFQQALEKFNSEILRNKTNSITAEFAKRVIPKCYQTDEPVKAWASNFFAEVTNYIVSRDTSGFVGEKYRNRTVGELIEFKNSLSQKVSHIVSSLDMQVNNKSDWNKLVDLSIKTLKSARE
ncbi:MAG TPA: hypothetical protein VGD22_17305 [Sphingobacteriaceae bacterium]